MAELLVPKLNNNDTEYVLTDWLVPDGTDVAVGDPVAVVETSKAAEELEATSPGTLRHALAAGAVCRPGERLAVIDDGTQPAPVPAAAAVGAVDQLVTRPAQQLMDELGVSAAEVAALGRAVVRREHVAALRPGAVVPGGTSVGSPGPAAPAGAVRTAGTGAAPGASMAPPGPVPAAAGLAPAEGGPVVVAPVAPATPSAVPSGGSEAAGFAGSGPVAADAPGVTRLALPRVQRGVARAVEISHRTIPAAYTVVRMDLGPALAYAKRVTREVRRPVGAGELFVREVALLHAEFPRFFASVEGSTALLADAPHIGVTVDLGEGLFVPCVRDAAGLSIGEIATRLMTFRLAATTGSFRERDLTGANFTVTLHTDADVVLAVPFVLPGTVCALAVTAPGDGSPANIGLAYDHRLINGREATLFLHALKNSMERLA
ncbi:2-oxo acid dehydrogenase subunit E2 [Streptomyces sp. NPDC021224]|uniref:2-oxo acid dehydrogenase subunit E2 n=1 Tax=unclassified Streptomyces TaxID=2593676 RepID=UPI00379E6B6C